MAGQLLYVKSKKEKEESQMAKGRSSFYKR